MSPEIKAERVFFLESILKPVSFSPDFLIQQVTTITDHGKIFGTVYHLVHSGQICQHDVKCPPCLVEA